jgi:hypothetical protein
METLKKVKATDVYQIAKVSYDALFSALKRLLPPEEMIFAETKKGYDQLFWVHPEGGWINYAEADESLQAQIEEAVAQHRERVRTLLSSQPNLQVLVDTIFTTPGNDFYYFRFAESGELQLMLSGWGFRKPVARSIGHGTVHNTFEKKQRVVISFSSQGKPVPHYEFVLHIPALSRTLSKMTDDEGFFVLSDQAQIGSKYQLEDHLTEQVFDLVVEEGRERYDYDVTIETDEPQPEVTEPEPEPIIPEPEPLIPEPEPEPEPIAPEPLIPEPEPEPEPEPIIPTPEPEPEPEPTPEPENPEPITESPILPILHVVGTDEQSAPDFPIEVQYEGQAWQFVTDQDGRVQLPEMKTGHQMQVTEAIDHATTSSYLLQPDTLEYVFRIPFSSYTGSCDFLIRTEDHNGQPFSGQIAFHQANAPTLLVRLDEKGQCWLDRNSFLLDTDIVADLSSAHAFSSPSLPKVTFQLHEGEKEYLLSLRKPASSMTLLEIFLALLGLVFLFFLFILFFV